MCPAAHQIPPYILVVGLGANLGDRLATLRRALAALTSEELTLLATSAVYETPPAGGPPQPDYLNAAAALRAHIPPRAVLERALAVERSFGRVRPDAERWGPRTIDIDLLWVSIGVIDEPGLVVPHPRLGERPFALGPLLEVVPEACEPHGGAPYADREVAHRPLRQVAARL
jgi:2-amino-4-hydroxy-6-hydroxymethyldihydropteridine diphosphokinase